MTLCEKAMKLRNKTGWGRVRIAKMLGISANTVGNWLHPSKIKDRKAWEREHRLTTTNHRRLLGRKRPYPENNACELCGKAWRELLDYHHYNDNNLSKGLWLCRTCHVFAEAVDKGLAVTETKLATKYKRLKSVVLRVD